MRYVLILLLLILVAPEVRAEIPLVGADSFAAEVLKSPVPVIVQFEAAWCPYCRKMQPRLLEFQQSSATKMKIIRVDVDRDPDLAAMFDVRSLPTLVIFHDGGPRSIIDGALSSRELAKWVGEYEAEFLK